MPSDSLAFLPPRLDGRVLAVARLLLPLWLRRAGLQPQPAQGIERLREAMTRFQAGQSRLLLAFRHPSLDDPAVMAQLLWRDLARRGRFRPHPHAQFLYDRGIPLWAGEGTSWLLSHLGGCSIQRGTLDLPALRTARALLLDGPYPFAAAPEGATNGHNEVVSALEPGVAQLAFWTADDLAKAGRPEATEVLPIGLQYSFRGSVWPAIEALLAQLERDAGLTPDPRHALDPERLYDRLIGLAERMLTLLERFYREAYHQDRPAADGGGQAGAARGDSGAGGEARAGSKAGPAAEAGAGAGAGADSETGARTGAGAANARIEARLPRLLDAALTVAEQPLGVQARGDLPERCRRIEQASWERLYPPGDGQAEATVLERGLAARLAEETARRMWHMRMVEAFVAVSGRYVHDCPSQERFADTLLLLWDTQCRIRGGDPGQRPRLGKRRARISIGEPLLVTARLADYRANRRGAVASLTAELQQRLEELIVPSG